MERTIINRDNTQTLEQQVISLTQRVEELERVLGWLCTDKPSFFDLEATQQFV